MDFPTFILTLLSGDWVFFNDDEISWDGKYHHIEGVQVNAAQMDEFMAFVESFASDFDDIQDVMNYFVAFLGEVEKDDGLIVPRSAIAPGIHEAIREGDLTGLTLANLASCGAAFQVKLQDENTYIVFYDTRLEMGIPSFFSLIARMLWDLRQGLFSLQDVPFVVNFAGTRNFDADGYFGDVTKRVLGSQENPGSMLVTTCPEIDQDFAVDSNDLGAQSDEPCFSAFASGFDDPTEMQADEELFDACLLSAAHSFPVTVAIEGTHVLDRASRIESIKVGDSLTLAADWQTEFFDPVGIEVFNENGETLGYVNEQFSPAMAGNRELACLLPFVTATVESVTPLSQRRKNAKHALMDIYLELDEQLVPDIWDMSIDKSVLEKIKALLAKPKAQRVLLSRSQLLPNQLKGAIDTSEALTEPYGSLVFDSLPVDDDDACFDESDDDETSERDEIISALQMLVLMGQLSGTTFPQSLLDQLDRAIEGDESINLEVLAQQFNDAAPEIHSIDFNDISFSENRRVDGRRFSVAVPDGWGILKDVEEGGLFSSITRPFVLVAPGVNDGDDISLSDRIMYSSLSGDMEVDEAMLRCGILDTKWAFLMSSSYDQSDDFLSLAAKPKLIWDEEVDAINTKCFVTLTDPEKNSNGLDCYIYPYALDHSDFLRGTFNYDDSTDLEQVKKFVIQIAQSIEIDNPIQPECEQTLEKALKEKVTPDEYVDMVASFIVPFTALRGMVFKASAGKYITQVEDSTQEAWLLAGARGVADYSNRAIPILSKLLDAYDKQVELHASEADLEQMRDSLESFDNRVFPVADSFSEDPEDNELFAKAGVFDPSLELQQLRARLAL